MALIQISECQRRGLIKQGVEHMSKIGTDSNVFGEFFSVPKKARRKPAALVAVWPCGARWEIEPAPRGEWSAPIYRNGEQTGVDVMADTRAELVRQLESEGARIERKAKPEITFTADNSGTTINASWTDDSAQYHVWIARKVSPNSEVLGPWEIGETIYKNPPLKPDGSTRWPRDAGYFDTRKMDFTAKAWAAIRARIVELATPEHLDSLVAAKREAVRLARESADRAARARALRKAAALIEDASDDELAALLPPAGGIQTDAQGRHFVDMTPSWSGVLMIHLTVYANGNAKGREIALEELRRMASYADHAVLLSKIARTESGQ